MILLSGVARLSINLCFDYTLRSASFDLVEFQSLANYLQDFD